MKKKNAEARNPQKEPELPDRNQSIQINNLLQINGQNILNNKLQTIRESSALAKNNFPFKMGGNALNDEPRKTPL